MSNVLVVIEQQAGALRKISLPVLGFGIKAKDVLGGELFALVIGSGVGDVASEVSKFEGVDKVYVCDNAGLENYVAENHAPAIAEIAEELEAEIIATAASTRGRDFMPRVAAKMEAAQISDAIDIFDGDEGITYKRPMFAGNLISLLVSESDVTCVTVRTTAFDSPPATGGAEIEAISADTDTSDATEFVSFEQVKSDRPELTDADVIIAGGRGLKARENFGMLESLADLLGGAVGASRAAVDNDMAPNDWQIGQTGKIVAPNLYLAIAISGAIQHLAGMKGSKTVVAINKDPDAPIFQVADYGLVADAFEVVPQLTEKIQAIKG
jgi:electron transfer flavoprotein alpha subunit